MTQHLIVSRFRWVDRATGKRVSLGDLLHRFFPPSSIESKDITDFDRQLKVLHRFYLISAFVPPSYCHTEGRHTSLTSIRADLPGTYWHFAIGRDLALVKPNLSIL